MTAPSPHNTPAQTPRFTAREGAALFAALMLVALAGWVIAEYQAAAAADQDLRRLQIAHDQAKLDSEALFDMLGEYDQLLTQSRADESRIATEIAEYQAELEILRSRTQSLERVSGELARLQNAIDAYAQAERRLILLLDEADASGEHLSEASP